MKKKIIVALCALSVLIPTFCVHADYSENDLKNAVNDAVKWKDENDNPLYSIGTTDSNLYITALSRMGLSYDYASYLAGLNGVAAAYGEAHSAEDMQRSAIAAAAAGGSAQYVGGRDLVADSTYYRDAVSPVDKTGVNGLSWALITLDSGNYQIPDWGIRDRNSIIAGILSHQNTDGSFDDSVYDTACAVTALAPYYSTSGAYTITQNQTGWTFDLSPRDAVDNALDYLSDEQLRDGDWGDMASTAMTVIALDAMNIDADSDKQFTARNGSALDGLMNYRNSDGGFSSDLNKSDGEATSYALCALASHLRKIQGKSTLFNMTVNDTNVFATPAPTSSSSATPRPSATAKASTPRPSATAKTSTPRPSATTRPSSTKAPTNTMRPTKTAAPHPSATPRASATPRPTKRPALVGPVQMPGPVKPTDAPDFDEEESAASQGGTLGKSIAAASVSVVLLGVLIALIALKNAGKLPSLRRKNKNQTSREKSKTHRKTEEHRRFEQREKYKERLKFKNKR